MKVKHGPSMITFACEVTVELDECVFDMSDEEGVFVMPRRIEVELAKVARQIISQYDCQRHTKYSLIGDEDTSISGAIYTIYIPDPAPIDSEPVYRELKEDDDEG